jgi:hypothetical protein
MFFLVSIFAQQGVKLKVNLLFLPRRRPPPQPSQRSSYIMHPPTKACFDIGLASRKRSPLKIESVMDLAFSKMPSFHWLLAHLPRSLTLPPSRMPSITHISVLQARISIYKFHHLEKLVMLMPVRLRGKPVAGATGAIYKD